MVKLVKIIVIILFLSISINAQQKKVSFGSRGYSIDLGKYNPEIIYSINELPEDIKNKVIQLHKERLGIQFYSKLTFASAVIINLDELYKLEPDFKYTKLSMYSYDVHYKFSILSKGLEEYFTSIKVKENGDIFEDINFPEVSNFPEKADIISLKDAVNIATVNGIDRKSISVSIDYSRNSDSLIWVIKGDYQEFGNSTKHIKVLEIDAHTGFIVNGFYYSSFYE